MRGRIHQTGYGPAGFSYRSRRTRSWMLRVIDDMTMGHITATVYSSAAPLSLYNINNASFGARNKGAITGAHQ